MTDNQKLIAAIAAGLLMMAKGCNPQPEPPAPVAIVAKSFDDYRELMGDVWTEGASKSFSTDREAFEWVKGQAETARKAAFAPVHQLEQSTFGGEAWDDAKRKSLWSKFATECQ